VKQTLMSEARTVVLQYITEWSNTSLAGCYIHDILQSVNGINIDWLSRV